MLRNPAQLDVDATRSTARVSAVDGTRFHQIELANRAEDDGEDAAIPEGGHDAWKCLMGSFLMMIPSFGFQTASEWASQHPS